jgi:hypothetical protein
MSEKPQNDATVQMSPEEVARLHKQLAAQNAAAGGAPAPTPAAPATVGAPRPAAPVSAAPSNSSAGAVAGGLGALVSLGAAVLLFLPKLQGSGNDTFLPGLIATTVGYLLLAVGLFGTAKRTSGFGIVAGLIATAGALAFAVIFLGVAGVIGAADLRDFVDYTGAFGPPAIWFFTAIWGFAGLRNVSAGLGIGVGILGMLGAAGQAAAYAMLIAGELARGTQDDTFMALDMLGSGGQALTMLLLVIAFFGPVASAMRR